MPKALRSINLPAIGLIVGILLAWQAVVGSKLLNYDSVPPPTEIAKGTQELLAESEFYIELWFTLGNSLAAVGIAVIIAVPLGVILARSTTVRTYSIASLDLIRHIPLIALFPVALLVWGPTRKSEILLAAFAAIWPVLLNVMGGVSAVPPRMLEVAQVMRLSRLQTARKVILPAALTATVVGIRLAIVAAFLVTIVAEMLVSGAGLGWDFMVTQLSLDSSRLWSLALLAGLVGYLLNVVLERFIARVWPYYAIVNGTAREI